MNGWLTPDSICTEPEFLPAFTPYSRGVAMFNGGLPRSECEWLCTTRSTVDKLRIRETIKSGLDGWIRWFSDSQMSPSTSHHTWMVLLERRVPSQHPLDLLLNNHLMSTKMPSRDFFRSGYRGITKTSGCLNLGEHCLVEHAIPSLSVQSPPSSDQRQRQRHQRI